MKKIPATVFFFVVLFVVAACNKDEAATKGFDFSNSLPPYVELTSTKAKTVKQGESVDIAFQMRTGLQQKVTVYYDVTGGGLNLTNQTVTFDKEKTAATATVAIPNNVITPPATSATATLKVTKAVKEDGTQLTLGSKNTPATQMLTLKIVP
ncbi:hypothetical protein [Flavisolibacter nicotianae]|uniref:hypothetical protein n=1 Tax=Flavisolibacter nicotianae TaxID=2364882 RepID=UPI000EAFBD61|nr:hypothetical protein [Flavisolibacter nicotianae]